MKVKELIEILKKYDPEAEVLHNYDWGYEYYPLEERSIKRYDDYEADNSVLIIKGVLQ